MENWGLIIYKEQILIRDETPHPYDYLRTYLVIAHELGHQFFGNLVTCQWWDQIWLNEGLAGFFEYQLTDNVYPELKVFDYFNVNKLQVVFNDASLEYLKCMQVISLLH